MEQTGKYGLSQWDTEDRILMEDFNADNAKVEAALTQEAAARAALQSSMNAAISALETNITNNSLKIKTGTFTGTGVNTTRSYDIGVKPKLLVAWTTNTYAGYNYDTGIFIFDFACISFNSSGNTYMNAAGNPGALTATGFKITHKDLSLGLNVANSTLHYWALY